MHNKETRKKIYDLNSAVVLLGFDEPVLFGRYVLWKIRIVCVRAAMRVGVESVDQTNRAIPSV